MAATILQFPPAKLGNDHGRPLKPSPPISFVELTICDWRTRHAIATTAAELHGRFTWRDDERRGIRGFTAAFTIDPDGVKGARLKVQGDGLLSHVRNEITLIRYTLKGTGVIAFRCPACGKRTRELVLFVPSEMREFVCWRERSDKENGKWRHLHDRWAAQGGGGFRTNLRAYGGFFVNPEVTVE
jgi:hypothetical protein